MKRAYLAAAITALWAFSVPIASAATVQPAIKFLTRAGAAKLLLTASQEDIPSIRSDRFYPDVVENQWYTDYILQAVDLGMIDAEPVRGLIFPHRSISRAEFLKMMTLAFDLDRNLISSYADIPQDSWITPYAGVANRYQLFEDANTTQELRPTFRITQYEAERALELLFEDEPFRKSSHYKKQEEDAVQKMKTASTPQLVKEAMIRIFRRHGASEPERAKNELFKLVNEERTKEGLDLLTENSFLDVAAQKHAQDMYQRGYFGHVSPEGLDYVDRIRAADYLNVDQSKCECRAVFNIRAIIEKGREETSPHHITSQTEMCGCQPRFSLGENLAKGQLTPKQVMEDWMNSESHRRTILHPQFSEMGVGIFGSIWVETFGRVTLD